MVTLRFVVGFLSLCSLSFSQGCNRRLQENTGFQGTESSTVYSPDAEHCQLLCTQHPHCLFFTFIRPDWPRNHEHFSCYLMSSPSGQPTRQTPALGVTAGYSLKSCTPNPQPCLSNVYHNVDFPGSDYRSLFTADYEECQRACTQDPSCHFFTFQNGLFGEQKFRYRCSLKFNPIVLWTVQLRKFPGVISGFSHKAHITQNVDKDCRVQLFPNTDIPGNDIMSPYAVSAEHCHFLCSSHPDCTFFSFFSDNLTCHLKHDVELVSVAKADVTSGLPTRFCQPDNSWIKVAHIGIAFFKSDIRSEVMADPDACQRNCTDNPHCHFYTFIHEASPERRICHLNSLITLPTLDKIVKLANVVSGFSKKNCGL